MDPTSPFDAPRSDEVAPEVPADAVRVPSMLLIVLLGILFGAAIAFGAVADVFRRAGRPVGAWTWMVGAAVMLALGLGMGLLGVHPVVHAGVAAVFTVVALVGLSAARRAATVAGPARTRDVLPYLIVGVLLAATTGLIRPVLWILTGAETFAPH